MVGRILGGIATSILFSSFESWMIFQHFEGNHDKEWLNYTFFLQTFFNGIIAIVAGLIANTVTSFFGSKVAPFDSAIFFLTIGMVLIMVRWKENYGDQSANVGKNFLDGLKLISKDKGVLFLGLAQSCFESAMYIFVFMWTPILDQCFEGGYSHGLVFSIYMITIMMGSSLFNILSMKMKIEKLIAVIFGISAFALFIPILFGTNGIIMLIVFNLFELCVGVFWPSIGTLKSVYIPENVRSTVMNYFRLPTNFFVCFTLIFIDYLPYQLVFLVCSALALASFGSIVLIIVFYNKDRRYVKVATIDEEEETEGERKLENVTVEKKVEKTEVDLVNEVNEFNK